ncbi:MAG: radical SAM protein [Anaerolineaceae bacterium]|nr:radical SAM protein [Anaerolineaceae bacterium]
MQKELYRECRLCPRSCGVNRLAGEKGVCGETAECRLASSFPHFGEEPFFSGHQGSGAIFFNGCASRCFFCQNADISLDHHGKVVSENDLYRMAKYLIKKKVHNLNLVTPDHFWPHVEALCERLRNEGEEIPLLYNCSGYSRPEMIRAAAKWIDIFMPDFKYADPILAQQCMGDANYPDLAMASIQEMVAARGFLRPWDPEGLETAQKGVLVRHLVLPGQVENSLSVLQMLFEAFGPSIPISLMSQFRPTWRCRERKMLDRRVTREEYQQVLDAVKKKGFTHIYAQPLPRIMF